MTEKEKILNKLLSDTNRVCTKYNLEFWLDSGTLLGAIRDGSYIPWDNDIDLGCWKSDDDYQLKIKLTKELSALGYNIFCNDYYINIYDPQYPEYKLDLNFYLVDKNHAVTPSSSINPALKKYHIILIHQLIVFIFNQKITKKRFRTLLKMLYLPIYVIFILLTDKGQNRFINLLISLRKKLSKHQFEAVPLDYFGKFTKKEIFNGVYLIPQKSEEYLAYRYGKEWNVPIKDWDTITQDGTVAQF